MKDGLIFAAAMACLLAIVVFMAIPFLLAVEYSNAWYCLGFIVSLPLGLKITSITNKVFT